jgi:hypothetical protein
LSAEGGNGALIYSLIPGVGDEDNEFFTLEGTALKITAESLDQYDYNFRVKVEDGKGQSVEDTFILKVGPPDGSGETENPDAPNVPGVPGDPDNPNEGGETDDPDEDENSGGQAVGKPERVGAIVSKLDMRMIHLSWEATDRATSYEVRYSEGKNLAFATKFATEPTEPAVTVTGLSDGTAYNFWVVAKNSSGAAMASPVHPAKRTSDGIPEYLLYHLIPGGPGVIYSASNLWPQGDMYQIRDLGEDYPINARYHLAYGGSLAGLYPGGTIAFIRCFAGSDTESYSGVNQEGCMIYQFESSGQQKFQAVYYLRGHLPPTVFIDYQSKPSHPPAAIMGQANGYSSGLGNTQIADTLEEAITKYAHKGGGPIGTGGMTDYFTPMTIYYSYNPDYNK